MWICCRSEKNLVFVFFEKKLAEKEDSLKDEKGSSVSSSTKQVKIVSLRKEIFLSTFFFAQVFGRESTSTWTASSNVAAKAICCCHRHVASRSLQTFAFLPTKKKRNLLLTFVSSL